MRAIRAKTVVQAPGRVLEDGLVVFDRGRVAACGPWREERRAYSGPVEDLGPVAVCAGVLNMHAHLELSHLLGRTVAGRGFTAWVKSLLALPASGLDAASLDAAVGGLAACGTAWVADIGDRNPALVAGALDRAGLGYVLGVEFFGHRRGGDLAWPPDTANLTPAQWERVSAAGHALYSTDAGTLRAARAWCRERGRIFPLHLAEHRGEVELLAHGGGEFADLLRQRVLPEDFLAPGCSPVAHARDLGLLGPGTLAVHCVQLADGDVDTLAKSGAAVCLCPRSNDYIGVGRAPWEALRDAGIPLCLGTDSLSSNTDLDVRNEALAVVRASEGAVSAMEALSWLTLSPARILGLENTHGTLESGKVAGYSIVPDELGRLL
ncbi:amidohydrolase family protein [Desulfocurvus sp. DL9XJH121]